MHVAGAARARSKSRPVARPKRFAKQNLAAGRLCRPRMSNPPGFPKILRIFGSGDPYRIRTDVKGVRGLCLNHLTNGPYRLFGCLLHPQNRTMYELLSIRPACIYCRSSPRVISTGQLHTLPCFHLRPINQVVLLGPYPLSR